MKRALLVAYHFPPGQVSSGLQRTLALVRNLPAQGWEPMVLSAHPRAYQKIADDQLRDIPENVLVKRAFALDTAKHLSVRGKYFDYLALPDRWVSWCIGGICSGLSIIRQFKPAVIWTTYPIATAHLIGLALHKITGLPWIADFRDSMTEPDYPRELRRRKVYQWIERKTIQNCSHAVFTTPGALQMYRERYPDEADQKWLQIPNGFNEQIFQDAEQGLTAQSVSKPRNKPIQLVHSGVIYPSERDPEQLFDALHQLKVEQGINGYRLRLTLRATGHDHIFKPMLQSRDIEDMVELVSTIPYRDALREMLTADGLLLLQAANCNHQIPAKVYEYLRARRPVFALTDSQGDTAAMLRAAGLDSIAPLDDSAKIKAALKSFLDLVETGQAPVANDSVIELNSREHSVVQLAKLFDTCARPM